MFNFIFLTLYRLIVQPLVLLSALVLYAFPLKKNSHLQKLKKGLELRLNRKNPHHWSRLKKHQNPIWIHCSSGEFEYAKPLITALKQKHPHETILVTFFSPSYAQAVATFPGVDMHCVLPWDTPGSISSFIQHHKPKLVLLSRTDLWPEMLFQLKKRKIPILLFSAARPHLKLTHKLFKPLFNWIYSPLTAIYCVHKEDSQNLSQLAPHCAISALGDTRYDQVLARLKNSKAKLKTFSPELSAPKFIAGSTWPEDEAVLSEVLTPELGYQSLIVPHEVDALHIQNLQSTLQFPSTLYSKRETLDPHSITIVNQVGILAELYLTADIAFVGGSFKNSVHSVMEPLAAGLPTLVGPQHRNNREAVEFQSISVGSGFSAVTAVQSPQELRENLLAWQALTHQEKAEIKENIIKEVQARTGATQRLIQALESHL